MEKNTSLEYNAYVQNCYEIFMREEGHDGSNPDDFDMFFSEVTDFSTWFIQYERDRKINEILK